MDALLLLAGAGGLTWIAYRMERAGYGRDSEERRVERLNADLAKRRWWLATFARRYMP